MEPEHNTTKPKPNSRAKATHTVLRFAGLGTTLAASIGIGVIGGQQLDIYLELEMPLGTALCAIIGLAVGMWSVLRNIQSK